jgi:hypothetical protein
MITSLTKHQESQFSVYRDKWTAIGLATGRANRAAAEKACREAYEVAGLTPPKMILWAESPMGLLLTAKLIKEIAKAGHPPYSEMDHESVWDSVWNSVGNSVRNSVWDSVWNSVGNSVRNSVENSVENSVWSSVGSSVRSSVWSSVGSSVRSSVGSSVWNSVRNSVGSSVGNSVRNSVRDSVGSSVWNSVWDSGPREEWSECNSWGQHDAAWLGYYDYFLNECDLESCKKLLPLMNLAKETGWHLFYTDIAILSERPIELHRNNDGALHRDGGAAIKWADGYELFRLNGIEVPEGIAMVPANEITKDMILRQENADYRRELVRKLSGKQLLDVLNPRVMDEKYGYALLAIDLGDNRTRPFLKMTNPSIEAIHIEGVRPDCRSVEDAIRFRNGLTEFELPLTLDGFPLFTECVGLYHQQGDCIITPETIPADAVKCAHNTAGDGLIRHTLVNGEIYEKDGKRYLGAHKDCRVTHPEHKDVKLDEGMSYVVSKVQEYDHWKEEARAVID